VTNALPLMAILGAKYEWVLTVLEGYATKRWDGWDVYARKMSSDDRKDLADIFSRCRENGYFDLHAWGGKLYYKIMYSITGKTFSRLDLKKETLEMK